MTAAAAAGARLRSPQADQAPARTRGVPRHNAPARNASAQARRPGRRPAPPRNHPTPAPHDQNPRPPATPGQHRSGWIADMNRAAERARTAPTADRDNRPDGRRRRPPDAPDSRRHGPPHSLPPGRSPTSADGLDLPRTQAPAPARQPASGPCDRRRPGGAADHENGHSGRQCGPVQPGGRLRTPRQRAKARRRRRCLLQAHQDRAQRGRRIGQSSARSVSFCELAARERTPTTDATGPFSAFPQALRPPAPRDPKPEPTGPHQQGPAVLATTLDSPG